MLQRLTFTIYILIVSFNAYLILKSKYYLYFRSQTSKTVRPLYTLQSHGVKIRNSFSGTLRSLS